MEYKHFSHIHGLVFHQTPQGFEIHCSAVNLPGSGNVYACWKCNYFLHEQCFRATRSLNHPSHPVHPLTLVSYPTYPSTSFFCNSCNLIGNGFCYCCSECEFDVHVHCAHVVAGAASPHGSSQLTSVPISNLSMTNHDYSSNHQVQNSIYPPIQNNLYPNHVSL